MIMLFFNATFELRHYRVGVFELNQTELECWLLNKGLGPGLLTIDTFRLTVGVSIYGVNEVYVY